MAHIFCYNGGNNKDELMSSIKNTTINDNSDPSLNLVIATRSTNSPLIDLAISEEWIDSNADTIYYRDIKDITALPSDGKDSPFSEFITFDEFQYFTSVTSIGETTFLGCTNLESIIIPYSVISIGEGAFSGCTGLTDITIGNIINLGITSLLLSQVTSIGSWAFLYCISLTNITLPASVTQIGAGAFEDCTSLTSIIVHSNTPPELTEDGKQGYNQFLNTNDCSIKVPHGKASTYKAATGWSTYSSRIIDNFALTN